MFSSNQLVAIYSVFTVIKTEFNPSCIANFEMIAGVCVFELNFESNPAVFIAGQDVIIIPITGTQMNEAQIVCTLESYHPANGEYCSMLDILAPQFIGKLPHDILGGDPFNYRAMFDGKFLLYSAGWNETDDGGVDSSQIKSDKGTYAEGDWVWKKSSAIDSDLTIL